MGGEGRCSAAVVDSFAYVVYAEYFLIIASCGYAAFWAFNIRRALVVGVYRSHASGTGLIAAVLGATIVAVAANVTGDQLVFILFPLAVAITSFYFIDASTQAARRSDPLLRDTLRWSRTRKYIWALVLALAAVSGYGDFGFRTPSNYSSPELVVATQSVYFLVFGIGAVVIPLNATRSRDLTLRRHYKWFGIFLISLLLFTIAVAPTPTVNFLTETGFAWFVIADFEIGFFFMFVASYSLYRAAKSLVPLNRLAAPESRELEI